MTTTMTKPGRLTARYIKSLVLGGDGTGAAAYCASQKWTESEVLQRIHKAAVTAMGSDIAAVQYPVGQDVASLVNPETIIGRLPQAFRLIPSDTNCITETSTATAYWGSGAGEGSSIPVSKAGFTRALLRELRCSGVSVVTRELAMISKPSAEATITRDVRDALVRKVDETFIDVTNLGSPEERPASITRNAPQFPSTGTSVASIDADLRLLLNSLYDGGSDLVNAAWVLHPRSAAFLASLRGSGGSPCYPGMGARGGVLLGLPCITSGSIARSGSPQETSLFLIDSSRVWLCDDGRMELSTSDATVVEMSDVPTGDSATGTGSSVVSMWQTESLAVKTTKWINWRAVDAASAAATLTRVNF